MSMFETFFKGFSFRSSYPDFEQDQEVSAYMTGYDEEREAGIVRVGDTILEVPDATPDLLDQELQLRITDFDQRTHRGRAEQVTSSETDQN